MFSPNVELFVVYLTLSFSYSRKSLTRKWTLLFISSMFFYFCYIFYPFLLPSWNSSVWSSTSLIFFIFILLFNSSIWFFILNNFSYCFILIFLKITSYLCLIYFHCILTFHLLLILGLSFPLILMHLVYVIDHIDFLLNNFLVLLLKCFLFSL